MQHKSHHIKIGIHQPNFLPWLGYFYKIWASDIFVIHDDVEYSKRSLTKRTFIRKNDGEDKKYLGVPLVKLKDSTLIKDLIIDHSNDWQKKQVDLLRNTYSKAPFYKDYFPVFKELIYSSVEFTLFSDFSIYLIRKIMDILDIDTQLLLSSELQIEGSGSKLNINIIKYCNGTIYNSGMGARKYQSEKDFHDGGITLNYIDVYSYLTSIDDRLPKGFINGMSIIDSLFYLGSVGVVDVFNGYLELEKLRIST